MSIPSLTGRGVRPLSYATSGPAKLSGTGPAVEVKSTDVDTFASATDCSDRQGGSSIGARMWGARHWLIAGGGALGLAAGVAGGVAGLAGLVACAAIPAGIITLGVIDRATKRWYESQPREYEAWGDGLHWIDRNPRWPALDYETVGIFNPVGRLVQRLVEKASTSKALGVGAKQSCPDLESVRYDQTF